MRAGAPWPDSARRPPHRRWSRCWRWTRRLTEAAGVAAGTGSSTRRQDVLRALFVRLTKDEQQFLFRLVTGELRQGALEGVMVDADRGGGRGAGRGRAARVHAVREARHHRRRGADRRAGGAGGVPADAGHADQADAGVPGGVAGRSRRRARRGDRRVQDGRCPDPGAPPGRRGARLDADAARDHLQRPGAGRARAGAAVRVGGAGRRNARPDRRRSAAAVPGHDEPVRQHARGAGQGVAAAAVLLRLPAPRRRRPAGRAAVRTQRGAAQGRRRARDPRRDRHFARASACWKRRWRPGTKG